MAETSEEKIRRLWEQMAPPAFVGPMTTHEMLVPEHVATEGANEMSGEDVNTLVSLALHVADNPGPDAERMLDLEILLAEVVARDPWNVGRALIDGCNTVNQKVLAIKTFSRVGMAHSGKRVTPIVLSGWLLEQSDHPEAFDGEAREYLADAVKGLMLD